MNWKRVRFLIFVFFALAALFLAFIGSYMGYSQETVKEVLGKYSVLAPVLFVLIIIAASATTLPVTIAVIPGVMIFSFAGAIAYTLAGTFISGIMLFFFARKTGKEAIEEYSSLKEGRLRAFENFLKDKSTGLILLLYLVYFFPSYLSSMLAGISEMKLWRFVIINLLGNLLNSILMISLVYSLANNLFDYTFLSIGGIALISLVSIILYRKHIRDILVISFGDGVYKRARKIKNDVGKIGRKKKN